MKKTAVFVFIIVTYMAFSSLARAERPDPLTANRFLYEYPQWEHMSLFGDKNTLSPAYKPAENYVAEWKKIGIVTGRGVDNQSVPYVLVGPNFYFLSGWEKRDVAKALDIALGLTGNPTSIYRLRDWDTKAIVGEYDGKSGLILQ